MFRLLARGAAAILAIGLALPAAAVIPHPLGEYSDLWWNPAEPGWGVSLTHRQDTDRMFAAWYVYDADGHASWVVMVDGRRVGAQAFSGELFTTMGPDPRGAFDSRDVLVAPAGLATITFDTAESGRLDYIVNGVAGSRPIARQKFGSPATPVLPIFQRELSDLWWNARESGWGVAIHQQNATLFAIWFAYGPDHRPVWYVMSGGEWVTNYRYTGRLYRTSRVAAPYFGDVPFDPAGVSVREVGTLSFTLTNAAAIQMNYEVDGVSGVKMLTRQPF